VKALLATVAAAGLCEAAASAQELLSAEEILAIVPGAWESDPAEVAEDARGTHRCDQEPEVIRIRRTDDGLVYESTYGYADDAALSRSAVRTTSNAILLRYDGEARLTPDGRPVEWLLFMPDRDHFFWVRTDWLNGGEVNRTAMRRRCPGAIS
jgi:hypothetical protein